MIRRRLLLRLAVALPLLAAHALVDGWLTPADPLAAALATDPLPALGLAVLLPLRIVAWGLVPPWLVAGTLADWLDQRALTMR